MDSRRLDEVRIKWCTSYNLSPEEAFWWQREELSSTQVSGRCRLRVAAGHRGGLRRVGTAGYGMIGGPGKKTVPPETTGRLERGTDAPRSQWSLTAAGERLGVRGLGSGWTSSQGASTQEAPRFCSRRSMSPKQQHKHL